MMKKIKFLFYLPFLFLTVPWTAFCCVACVVASWFSYEAAQKVQTMFGRGVCTLIGIDVRFAGSDRWPSRGVIAPNHASIFDIIVLASLPVKKTWISKKEVGKIPLMGTAMKALGCYFLERTGTGRDLAIMREVEQGLKDGKSVVIFPEGTRTRTGELLPFKKGAFKTAQNAGVPVVPVAIQGTYSIAPPGKLPRERGHKVFVRFGEPQLIGPGEDLNSAIETFRKSLILLLETPG